MLVRRGVFVPFFLLFFERRRAEPFFLPTSRPGGIVRNRLLLYEVGKPETMDPPPPSFFTSPRAIDEIGSLKSPPPLLPAYEDVPFPSPFGLSCSDGAKARSVLFFFEPRGCVGVASLLFVRLVSLKGNVREEDGAAISLSPDSVEGEKEG